MKITISGTPGSGKTTVGKVLAKKLKLKFYDAGALLRKEAREKGITLQGYTRLAEKNPSIDKKLDKRVKELGKKEKKLVISGRTDFYFIPDSTKIFLKTSVETGAKRILKDKRKTENYKTLKETKEMIKKRMKSDRKRYKKYYNVDIFKKENYDLIINTTNLTVKQTADKIIRFVKKK